MSENSAGYPPPGKPPEQPGYGPAGKPPEQPGYGPAGKPPEQPGYGPAGKPPEQPGYGPPGKPPEPSGDDKCPDPSGPYTLYRVAAEVAKKKESLFTADATAVAAKYDRLAGAQKQYADAWADQKKNWADLWCQIERIRDNLHHALDEATRKHLEDCWKSLNAETTKATQPPDCKDIVGLDCKKLLDDVMNLAPDKLADALVNWHRQAEHAKECADQDDKDFDDLADFPGKLPDKISSLKTQAGNIDDALAKPGNDLQRSYVEYLKLHYDFCEVWRKIITAAAYTCKLKYVFVRLLKTHQAWICLQVAIDGAEKRESIEDEAKQAKSDNVIDLVLECALPAKADDSTTPPGDCAAPEKEPEPGQYGTPQPQPGQYGTPQPQPGQYGTPQPQPGQYGTPQPQPGQYGTPGQQPEPGPAKPAGG